MSLDITIERTVTGLGYDFVEVERGPRGLLRVFIDRVGGDPNGPFVTVDDCEKVTRQLQHVLEVENYSYERLEISSPGLDRLIRKPSDFQRFSGQEIEVNLKMPFQGRKKYRGILQAVQEGVVGEACAEQVWRLIFSDGKVDQALDFSLQEVREARLVPVVDFKGRRFLPSPANELAQAQAEDQVDGDDKK